MPTSLSIQPIHTLKELREMVAFAWEIYKDDPLWVPPVFDERVARLDPARNPMLKHGELQAFVARRDGRIVGTIAGAIDYNLKNVIPDPFAAFGFFECINDYNVAEAMLDAVIEWACAKGQVRMRGPYNPTQNDEQGFLVEGRDRIPIILTAHNPLWYPEFVERYGLCKWGPDLFCYGISADGLKPDLSNLPPKLGRVLEVVRQRTRAKIRTANFADWDNEVVRARQVYNRSLAVLADFIPLDADEFHRQVELLRPVLDPDLVLFVDVDAKTIGFALGLPNVNEALHHANGLRRPWDYLRFLWDRRNIKGMSIKIIALDPDYWGRGLDALMYGELARQMVKKGFDFADLSLTGEDNPQTNKLAKVIGAEVYKRYRIYQLEI
jgi:GNAT superfamily N-acetyltransferase